LDKPPCHDYSESEADEWVQAAVGIIQEDEGLRSVKSGENGVHALTGKGFNGATEEKLRLLFCLAPLDYPRREVVTGAHYSVSNLRLIYGTHSRVALLMGIGLIVFADVNYSVRTVIDISTEKVAVGLSLIGVVWWMRSSLIKLG
jgi:hypothetical protein